MVILVELFAPWCSHCQALTLSWWRAAIVLKGTVTTDELTLTDCLLRCGIARSDFIAFVLNFVVVLFVIAILIVVD